LRHKTKKLKSIKTPARTKKPFADYFFAARIFAQRALAAAEIFALAAAREDAGKTAI
jgi:hypothetical protein